MEDRKIKNGLERYRKLEFRLRIRMIEAGGQKWLGLDRAGTID